MLEVSQWWIKNNFNWNYSLSNSKKNKWNVYRSNRRWILTITIFCLQTNIQVPVPVWIIKQVWMHQHSSTTSSSSQAFFLRLFLAVFFKIKSHETIYFFFLFNVLEKFFDFLKIISLFKENYNHLFVPV